MLFLSTPSARRATAASAVTTRPTTIFLSTPSARRATHRTDRRPHDRGISIHALREEGDRHLFGPLADSSISIHALREEGDARSSASPAFQQNFYPRPPRGGRRQREPEPCQRSRFLSTPSARRATKPHKHTPKIIYISIHALREEGDDLHLRQRNGRHISIHALREEGDKCPCKAVPIVIISIHALREEGDRSGCRSHAAGSHFYPRPPRGGRLIAASTACGADPFLSTPSARRATSMRCFTLTAVIFLSTPSARRATSLHFQHRHRTDYFYPRPPRGGRRDHQRDGIAILEISIHALREEGDRHFCFSLSFSLYFYPRPPRGGRHFFQKK